MRLRFHLSHTARGEGGETVLKMNREIYFSFLHFIASACAIKGICHVGHPSPCQPRRSVTGEGEKQVRLYQLNYRCLRVCLTGCSSLLGFSGFVLFFSWKGK